MGRGRKSSLKISLTDQDRETLERWQRSSTLAAGQARRGRMILLLSRGYTVTEVARTVGVQRTVVQKWARRFLAEGIAGLMPSSRRSRKTRSTLPNLDTSHPPSPPQCSRD